MVFVSFVGWVGWGLCFVAHVVCDVGFLRCVEVLLYFGFSKCVWLTSGCCVALFVLGLITFGLADLSV